MKGARPGDVVEVRWLDAQHISFGWDTAAAYIVQAAKPQSFRSAGYLVTREGPQVIVVLSADANEGKVADVIAVPRDSVRRITVLRRSGKRTRAAFSVPR